MKKENDWGMYEQSFETDSLRENSRSVRPPTSDREDIGKLSLLRKCIANSGTTILMCKFVVISFKLFIMFKIIKLHRKSLILLFCFTIYSKYIQPSKHFCHSHQPHSSASLIIMIIEILFGGSVTESDT